MHPRSITSSWRNLTKLVHVGHLPSPQWIYFINWNFNFYMPKISISNLHLDTFSAQKVPAVGIWNHQPWWFPQHLTMISYNPPKLHRTINSIQRLRCLRIAFVGRTTRPSSSPPFASASFDGPDVHPGWTTRWWMADAMLSSLPVTVVTHQRSVFWVLPTDFVSIPVFCRVNSSAWQPPLLRKVDGESSIQNWSWSTDKNGLHTRRTKRHLQNSTQFLHPKRPELEKIDHQICVQPSLIVSSSFCKLCFLFSVCNPVEGQDDPSTGHGYHLMKCCMPAWQKMWINKRNIGWTCDTFKLCNLKGFSTLTGLKKDVFFLYKDSYPPDVILWRHLLVSTVSGLPRFRSFEFSASLSCVS